MTILAIGDIHGKRVWRQFVDRIATDVVVFVGDYIILREWLFNRDIRENLQSIIEFKRSNFGRVHLLLGNHDIPFLYHDKNFRKIISPQMAGIYRDNSDCFEIAYQYQDIIFSHGGISEGWFEKHNQVVRGAEGSNLADKLNSIHRSDSYRILHERGKARGGPFEHGGLTYADKIETEKQSLPGYTQVVGHTKVPHPVRYTGTDRSIIYIDCLNATEVSLVFQKDQFFAADVTGSLRALNEAIA